MNNEPGTSISADMVEYFDIVCEKLELDPAIKANALKAFHKIDKSRALDYENQAWLCCAVYSALQQARCKAESNKEAIAAAIEGSPTRKHPVARKDGNEISDLLQEKDENLSGKISLTHLLRCFNISISDFLQKMKYFNTSIQYSSNSVKQIEDMQRRLNISKLLLQHYKRIFKELFVWPIMENDQFHYQALYEFGWILFLVARNELPGFTNNNLITGFQLLICTIELVYINALEMPRSAVINRQFPGLPVGWADKDFNEAILQRYSCIRVICKLIPELPFQDVLTMKKAFFHKAILMLFMNHKLLGNDNILRHLVKDDFLEVNLSTLNQTYTDYVASINEMDERLLLNYKPPVKQSMLMPNTQRIITWQQFHCKLWNKEANSLSESQLINLGHLLANVGPKSALIRHALEENPHVMMEVRYSLKTMENQFNKASAAYLSKEACKNRFDLIKTLYYKLLDVITKAEIGRKPQLKIVQLLSERTFNKTLIACCLELVLYICAPEELQFPWALQCYAIDAFDFQKILELVVRHHDGLLTRALVKHLQFVEEYCLATLIWRKDSFLWRLHVKLPSFMEVQGEDDIQATVANKENRMEHVNVNKHVNSSADICFRKFYLLGRKRLISLCTNLSLLIEENAHEHIWQILEYSITRYGLALLQQRHLDQLIMCAIYLYARTLQLPIPFKTILQLYRWQPYARSSVYRAIHLHGTQTGDIISFYNQIYMPRMRTYTDLLNYSYQKEEFRKTPMISPVNSLRVNIAHNLFVSPLSKSSCMWPKAANLCASNETEKGLSNIKRASSHNELAISPKRPNILRRCTINE